MKKIIGILSVCLVVSLILGLGVTALATTNTPELAAPPDGSASPDSAITDPPTAGKSSDTEQESMGRKCHDGQIRVNVLTIAAQVLGQTEDEVKEAVKDGKVGDLLIAAGKVDEFKQAYLSEAKNKLNAAVAEGQLTQAQADKKYTKAEEKMAAYDGTTHLCGRKDHSDMFSGEKPSRGERPSKDEQETEKPTSEDA